MLPDWTPSALADAADENLAVHACAAARSLPSARVEAAQDLVLVDCGLPCDTFNFACRARLSAASAESRIATAIEFFAGTGHPFSWWLAPGYSPVDLPARLEAAGLTPEESELAMALDLASLPAAVEVAGLVIERVRTAEQLRDFAAISAANWSPPDPHVTRFYTEAGPHILAAASPQWLYLGRVDGIPVATAELTIGGGVVGLYNIATLAPWRGRGIGTAMTTAPLLEARAAGLGTAVLQAAPAGIGLYRRLGFVSFGEIVEFRLTSFPSAGTTRP